MYSFPNFEPVCCFVSGSVASSSAYISQEEGKVVWYSHLFKNFPQFLVIYTVKLFSIVNEADFFLKFRCFFYDPADVSNLICLFQIQLVHLEVHSSHIAEAWLGEFGTLLY